MSPEIQPRTRFKRPCCWALTGTVQGYPNRDSRLGDRRGQLEQRPNSSNLPTAYWIVPNTIQLDQARRQNRTGDRLGADRPHRLGIQIRHLFGIDYRYTTAGGFFSQQLLYHNNLYGYDPVEQYFELYIPRIFEGMVIRVGRWIACPDIETQYAPDNYLASHSLLFTYDTYTQTGAMFSFQLNQRNMVQGAIESGTDMAPWYPGALPTGFFGWRWVSQ